jgi:hypothetical protein
MRTDPSTVVGQTPQEWQDAMMEWAESGWTPMRRRAPPGDIADACALLCSDEERFVTGQAIAVDGGSSLMNSHFPLALQVPELRQEFVVLLRIYARSFPIGVLLGPASQALNMAASPNAATCLLPCVKDGRGLEPAGDLGSKGVQSCGTPMSRTGSPLDLPFRRFF